MKSYNIILLLSMLLAIFSSCTEEFLEETLLTQDSSERQYGSSEGLENLVTGCYATSKIWYGKEYGWDFSTVGTDIYDYGQQHPQQYQYTFSSDFNSSNSRLVVLWTEFYRGINACNDAISVMEGTRSTISNPFDEEKTRLRLSEVKYLRAFYNFLVVETWGGNAVLRTEPVLSALTTSQNSTEDAFYELILSDLNHAVDSLTFDDNVGSSNFGRVTKLAALAFRARVNLTLASYKNDNSYYTAAYNDAMAVINSGEFALYDDFADLWDLDNNANNSECIWAINYSRTEYAQIAESNEDGVDYDEYYTVYQNDGDKPWSDRDGGHHGHLMFGIQYDVMPGMLRDLENGRPFRRYFPTKYLIDAFNEDIDDRFYGSFKTTWFCNDPGDRYNVSKSSRIDTDTGRVIIYWVEYENLLGQSQLTDSLIYNTSTKSATWIVGPKFIRTDTDGLDRIAKKTKEGIELFAAEGDTAIYMIKGEFDDSKQLINVAGGYYWHSDRHFWTLDYRNMYQVDLPESDPNYGVINDDQTNNRNVGFELHKFYDNERDAATGDGSQRGVRDAFVFRLSEMYLIAAEAKAMAGEGGAYTLLQTLADKRAVEGKTGAELLASYGVNGDGDLSNNIDFFLDERAREFAGEQMRWFDLKRTGKFVERMEKYAGNAQARANVPAAGTKFTLRPIPQAQFDFITNKDEYQQNEGY